MMELMRAKVESIEYKQMTPEGWLLFEVKGGGWKEGDHDLNFIFMRQVGKEEIKIIDVRPVVNIDEIIQKLQGTCYTLNEVLQDMYGENVTDIILDKEHFEKISLELFNCNQCDWWYERSEEAEGDEGICEDCDSSIQSEEE